MAREPSYPEDAAVGRDTQPHDTKRGESSAAPAADDGAAEKAGGDAGRTKHLVTGAAIGIGSAALVAALLYANRSRKHDRGKG